MRFFLWRYYFEPEKNFGKEDEILATIFEVLASDIAERAADPHARFMTPDDLNNRLIVKLREKLKPYHR